MGRDIYIDRGPYPWGRVLVGRNQWGIYLSLWAIFYIDVAVGSMMARAASAAA